MPPIIDSIPKRQKSAHPRAKSEMPKSIYSPDKLRRFTPLFNKYSNLAEKTFDNSSPKVETVRQLVSPKQ